MQAVVLAAGFGERLRPLTEKVPKALLEVGGRPVIDYLLDFLSASPVIEMIHIRTNALYYPVFKDWLRGCDYMGRVELSSNAASTPKEKLGAVGDIEDICSRKLLREDIVVAAGDNIFNFPVAPFIDFCSGKQGDVVAAMESRGKKALKAGGVVVLTSDDRVIDFEERPKKPKSRILALPLYRLSAESIPFLNKYLIEGNDPDRIGAFFAWSYRRRPLFAFKADGSRYHLTDAASYRK
ncbi:MAG: NTP transferase domain-containing protein, partial [Candidatus Krumholzibacteria bacterium]|nr:NTP transferase domain-containing protein [Candidatus Krumholzibacteria bacterium]